jgi:hypothetical protein
VSHWIDDRYKDSYEPGEYDTYPADQLRQPVPGEPDLKDVLKPGDYFEEWNTVPVHGHLVIKLCKSHYLHSDLIFYKVLCICKDYAADNVLIDPHLSGIGFLVYRFGAIRPIHERYKEIYFVKPLPDDWAIGKGLSDYFHHLGDPEQLSLF